VAILELGAAMRRQRADPVVAGSLWSLLSVAVAAASGAVFWLLAAHLHSGTDVGRASALFTSVLFVNYATGMGLQVAVARYAADLSTDARFSFMIACVYTCITGVLGAIAYLAFIHPSVASEITAQGVLGTFGFGALVAGSSLAQLVEIRLMALRRWRLLVGRVALIGAARLPFLWLPHQHAVALFLFAIAPVALSGYLLAPSLWKGGGLRRSMPPFFAKAFRLSLLNYLSTLAVQAPTFIVPVIVLLNVSAVTNANFYVAWSIASIVFLGPATIAQVLLVEAGRSTSDIKAQLRLGLVAAVALMSTAFVIGWFGAGALTSVYGSTYRRAAEMLPLLLLAGIPWAVTCVSLAEARVRHDGWTTILITSTLAIAIVVPAVILIPHGGLSGAAHAWLGGHMAAGIASGGLIVWSRRSGRPSGAPPPSGVPVPEAMAVVAGEQP
jgi:O-antigen/teichoic acid export membrane protein